MTVHSKLNTHLRTTGVWSYVGQYTDNYDSQKVSQIGKMFRIKYIYNGNILVLVIIQIFKYSLNYFWVTAAALWSHICAVLLINTIPICCPHLCQSHPRPMPHLARASPRASQTQWFQFLKTQYKINLYNLCCLNRKYNLSNFITLLQANIIIDSSLRMETIWMTYRS